MNCDFSPIVGGYRCGRCGFVIRTSVALPLYRRCDFGPPAPPRVPFSGPGRELTRVIHEAGLKESSSCACDRRASQMNEWGIDGCRGRIPEIAGWLRESFESLGWREKLAAASKLAGQLDWLRPLESLVELAITRAEAKTLRVLVLSHEQEALDRLTAANHLRPVNLADIQQDNRLAESRVFLQPEAFPKRSAFLGLATANWNRKYGPHEAWHGRKWPHCLPLERLDELELEPHVVWCAAITDGAQWCAELDSLFPGCEALVDELIAHFRLPHKTRPGPLANNFIARRDVTLAHARFMRAAIAHLDDRYGRAWPISGERLPCFADRLPAFACECASILYFANRLDLELRQIPPPE